MNKKSIKRIITAGNLIILMIVIIIFSIAQTSKTLDKNELQSRIEAQNIITTLLSAQKLSDDITNFIRLYILTGEDKYKRITHKLWNIWSNIDPWPEDYHSYFSNIDANQYYEPKKSKIFNLTEHLIQLNASDYELSLLEDIHKISTQLYYIEMEIVNNFDNGETEIAKAMIYSNFYSEKNKRISDKISNLTSMVEYRLALQYNSKVFIQSLMSIASIALIIFITMFYVFYYRKTKNIVLSNIDLITKWSDNLLCGNYHSNIDTYVLDELKPITNSISNLSDKTYQLVKKLEEIAEQDELTKMPNRRAAINFLKQKQNEVSRYYSLCSVIIIDIDFFKKINDTYGHPVGDEILVNVGKLILQHSRDSDYAARLGGEEFMVIAPQTDLTSAYVLANKLKTKIASYIHLCGSHKISVTISCGVSSLVAGGNVEQTYKQADNALYLAKELGRNNVQLFLPRNGGIENYSSADHKQVTTTL